jgi:hypothetical protein
MTTGPKSRRRHPPPPTPAIEWFPTPPEYDHAPELGVLAILAGVLEGVSMVMLAANLELLDDDEPPYWRPPPPTVPAADAILRQVDRLRRAMDAYRRVAVPAPAPEPPPNDDIPF